jgi:hypothetical protein
LARAGSSDGQPEGPSSSQPETEAGSSQSSIGYGAFANGDADVDPDLVRLKVALAWVSARGSVVKVLGPVLTLNPGWDILLDLFIQQVRQHPVMVTSVCAAVHAPQTTAFRWITRLEEAGLVVRTPDLADRRRSLVALTADGADKVRQALDFSAEGDRKLGLGRLSSRTP